MMTRETKIGLLVGLAFLLVVGILLSEHITGSSERPAAPLADAGRAVRNGMSAPGAAADEPTPAEPTQPVPTAQDLTPKPAPVTQVTINVPGGSAPAVIDHTPVAPAPVTPAPVAPQPVPPTVVVPSPTIIVHNTTPTDPFANDPIRKLAEKAGEPIVPVDHVLTPANDSNKPNATAAREYKAAAGDTLSRLASQLPGGNVKANRDAVVALNPTLQKDPNKVIVGRNYLLPTVAAKPATQSTVVVVKSDEKKTIEIKPLNNKVEGKDAKDAKTADTKTVETKPTDLSTRVYVVKAGDTLSKIASNELGSKSEVPTIRTMNVDQLKGTDVIKVNMKLKLPAKAVASASMR